MGQQQKCCWPFVFYLAHRDLAHRKKAEFFYPSPLRLSPKEALGKVWENYKEEERREKERKNKEMKKGSLLYYSSFKEERKYKERKREEQKKKK